MTPQTPLQESPCWYGIKIAAANGGTDLGPEAAEHEWELRFAPMRLKRIGPSIVPTEVVVPLAQMPAVLAEIDKKIKALAHITLAQLVQCGA